MPEYTIRCRNCKLERPLLLTSYADYDRIVSMMPCESCGKCQWTKLPSAPNIPPDGTYSWRGKK